MTYKDKNKLREYKRRYSKTPARVAYLKMYREKNKDKINLRIRNWRYRLPVQRQDFSTVCHFCHGVQHGKFKPLEATQ